MRPVAAVAFALASMFASPPIVTDSSEAGADETGGGDGVTPQLSDATDGYWLSVELIGPRGAQLDAAQALARPPIIDALPRTGAPPPGELVGRVETLDRALRWVADNAFSPVDDGPDALPIPGGRLYEDHGLVLTALVVSAATIGAAQPPGWPPAAALPLPEGVGWRPASLAVARAPVFAAPSPTLPPAAERYQLATLDDAIWLLSERDLCTDERACLRWAQILIRHGDRFFGGWLPAGWVVPDDAWVGGPQERRFALRPSHRSGAAVGYVLLEQRVDRREAPVGLQRAHAGLAWPEATVEVLGEELVVVIGGEPVLTRHIELSLG